MKGFIGAAVPTLHRAVYDLNLERYAFDISVTLGPLTISTACLRNA